MEMTTYPNKPMKANELQLGDVVTAFYNENPGPWSTAIVKKVTDDSITFYRPYGTKADFSYTGGVICYMGLEEYTVPRNDSRDIQYYVWQRDELK
jgi:hypothetical protein